jgi:hypothetical protein
MLKKDLPKTAIKGIVDDIKHGGIEEDFRLHFVCIEDDGDADSGFTFATDGKTWTRGDGNVVIEKGWVRDVNKAKSAVIYDCRIGDMHRHEWDPQVLFIYYPGTDEFIMDRPKWFN